MHTAWNDEGILEREYYEKLTGKLLGFGECTQLGMLREY